MAHKKKATRRRKKVHHLSAGPKRRRHSVGKRKTSRRRRSHGLSAIFTPAGAMAAGKAILGAAGGGFFAGVGHKMMKDQNVGIRLGAGVVVSALLYAVVGMPNVAAGFAGGVTALESDAMTTKLMSEMGLSAGKYADAGAANMLPSIMGPSGQPLSLMEDTDTGEMLYFDEGTGETFLAEDVYPQYSSGARL